MFLLSVGHHYRSWNTKKGETKSKFFCRTAQISGSNCSARNNDAALLKSKTPSVRTQHSPSDRGEVSEKIPVAPTYNIIIVRGQIMVRGFGVVIFYFKMMKYVSCEFD